MVPRPAWMAFVALASLGAFSQAACAQDASDWAREAHSAVRLLAGSRNGTVLIGGIEFELQGDWKTYWRTPGDSGVPPRFDFSKSDNVESVTPLFPVPMKFPDGAGGTSYGYKKHVILPLRIVPKEADKPMTVRLTLNYAVCEKLCVPAEADLELGFASAASTKDAELREALNTVPTPKQIGNAGSLGISAVTREARRVYVDVAKPPNTHVELFAEGPTDQWALPEPKPVASSPPGLTRFAFELDGVPADAHIEGSLLKLTLASPEAAQEYSVPLN